MSVNTTTEAIPPLPETTRTRRRGEGRRGVLQDADVGSAGLRVCPVIPGQERPLHRAASHKHDRRPVLESRLCSRTREPDGCGRILSEIIGSSAATPCSRPSRERTDPRPCVMWSSVFSAGDRCRASDPFRRPRPDSALSSPKRRKTPSQMSWTLSVGYCIPTARIGPYGPILGIRCENHSAIVRPRVGVPGGNGRKSDRSHTEPTTATLDGRESAEAIDDAEERMSECEARERLTEILRDFDERLSDEDRAAMSTDVLYDEDGLPSGPRARNRPHG